MKKYAAYSHSKFDEKQDKWVHFNNEIIARSANIDPADCYLFPSKKAYDKFRKTQHGQTVLRGVKLLNT